MPDVDAIRVEACHWLLLRLAGTAPDRVIAQCRGWLAQGREVDVGRAIARLVVGYRMPLHWSEVELLVELLIEGGTDPSVLSRVRMRDSEPLPGHAFAADRAMAGTARRAAADSVPERAPAQQPPCDELDRLALEAAATIPAVRAVWRSWRYAVGGDEPPRRVVLLEVDPVGNLAEIAGTVGDQLVLGGENHPQVEVYPTGLEPMGLPAYQRLARAYGALLWARECGPELEVARFPGDRPDAEEATCTGWGSDSLALGEVGALLTYLRRGTMVLQSPQLAPDVLEPSRPRRVPVTYRTDGLWVWSDACGYYLEHHGRVPDRRLVAHIRRRGFVPPLVDAVAMAKAVAVLRDVVTTGPVWLAG